MFSTKLEESSKLHQIVYIYKSPVSDGTTAIPQELIQNVTLKLGGIYLSYITVGWLLKNINLPFDSYLQNHAIFSILNSSRSKASKALASANKRNIKLIMILAISGNFR